MYIILLGMLAKAKGQILRVAACLQMLFCDEAGPEETITIIEPIPKVIREDAIVAAQNYVDVCCEHVSFLTRKKSVEEVMQRYTESKNSHMLLCYSSYYVI